MKKILELERIAVKKCIAIVKRCITFVLRALKDDESEVVKIVGLFKINLDNKIMEHKEKTLKIVFKD